MSFTVSPATLSAGSTGNTVVATGSGTAWNAAIPSGITFRAVGDSITQADPGYITPLATARGWTVTNYGIIGSPCATQYYFSGGIYGVRDFALGVNDVSTLLTGVNDMRTMGTNAAKQAVYQGTLQAMLAWLALPDGASKLLHTAGGLTYSAGWGSNQYGHYNFASGATVTGTVSGTAVYVTALCSQNNPSTFTVTIDGTVYGPYSGNNSSGSQDAFTPKLVRIGGLSAGSHTVVFTIGSPGTGQYFEWMGGNSGARAPGPRVFVGNCIRLTSAGYALGAPYDQGSDTAVAQFNAIIAASVALLRGDGLAIYLVDTANYDPALDTSVDGVHPNPTGYGVIASDFLAGIAASETSFSLSGGSGAAITAQSVNVAAQTANLTVNAGSAAGTLTVSDSSDADTATIAVTIPRVAYSTIGCSFIGGSIVIGA